MRETSVAPLGNLGLLFGMLGIIVGLGAISGWSYIWAAFSAWVVGVVFVLLQFVSGKSPT